MITYITNSFSLNMIEEKDFTATFSIVDEDFVREHLAAFQWISCVGHADTARLFSKLLGIEIPENRATIKIGTDCRLIVGQYSGPRLPEGATALPEGAKIVWFWIHGRYVPSH